MALAVSSTRLTRTCGDCQSPADARRGREAVRDHFAAMIDAYRGSGVATWKRIEIDVRELGEHAVFATERWNALDSEENVLRDTRTTYHVLSTSDGWRLLSYTNHC